MSSSSDEEKLTDNFHKKHYDRCCNPCKLEKHYKTKSLVRVSEKIRSLYPDLSYQELICSTCRRIIYAQAKGKYIFNKKFIHKIHF